jgi:hypothetical protein
MAAGDGVTGEEMVAGDVNTCNIDICPSREAIMEGIAAYIDHGLVDQWSAVEP